MSRQDGPPWLRRLSCASQQSTSVLALTIAFRRDGRKTLPPILRLAQCDAFGGQVTMAVRRLRITLTSQA